MADGTGALPFFTVYGEFCSNNPAGEVRRQRTAPIRHNQKELLLDTLRQALKTACFGDKMRVVLETLLDTL